jgi:uncharacterized protein YbaR (Trm112 family)
MTGTGSEPGTVSPGVAAGDGAPDHAAARVPDPRLLAILVCPMTRSPLRYDAAAQELVSDSAGLAYPIRDGVPVMLIEEAREV